MRWLELSVEADVEAVEAVSEILGRVAAGTSVHPTALVRDPRDELAAAPDPAAPFVVVAHIPDAPDAAGHVEATERALWHLQAFGLRPLSGLRVEPVNDTDWTERWKDHYVPQRIGRVVIVPSWIEHEARLDGVVVALDPGMAFGTGLHPTTRGCLKLLQRIATLPERVLDVGCGSGILAIAALRLGATSALALDTDADAVAATAENAARNELAARVEVRRGSLAEAATERFPLVLANLVAAVLVEIAPRLADHLAPGGALLASGIIAPRGDEVIAAMADAGLRVTDRVEDGEWLSLALAHAP